MTRLTSSLFRHDVTEATRELIKDSTSDIKNLSQYQTSDPSKAVSLPSMDLELYLSYVCFAFSGNGSWSNRSFPRIFKRSWETFKECNVFLLASRENM